MFAKAFAAAVRWTRCRSRMATVRLVMGSGRSRCESPVGTSPLTWGNTVAIPKLDNSQYRTDGVGLDGDVGRDFVRSEIRIRIRSSGETFDEHHKRQARQLRRCDGNPCAAQWMRRADDKRCPLLEQGRHLDAFGSNIGESNADVAFVRAQRAFDGVERHLRHIHVDVRIVLVKRVHPFRHQRFGK